MKKRVTSQINTTDTSRMTEFDLTGDPTTYGAFTKNYNPNYQFVQNTTPIAEPTIPKKTIQDFQRIYLGIDDAIKNNDKSSLQKWTDIYQKERADFDPDKQNQIDTLLKRQSNNTSVLQQVNVDALGDKFDTIGRSPITPENKAKLIALKDEYLQKRNTFSPQQIKFVDEELRTAYDNFNILNELPQLPPVQANTTQAPVSAPQLSNPVTQVQPQNTAPQSATLQTQNTPNQTAQNTPFDYKNTIENLKNLVINNKVQDADNLLNSILPKINPAQAQALQAQYNRIKSSIGSQNSNKAAYDMANNIVGSLVLQYPNFKTDINSQNTIRQRLNNYRPPANMANLTSFINGYANQIFNSMIGQQTTANLKVYNNLRFAQKYNAKQLMDGFSALNISVYNPNEYEKLKNYYSKNMSSYSPLDQAGINDLISAGDRRYNSTSRITPTPEAKQYLRDQVSSPRQNADQKQPVQKNITPQQPQQKPQQQTTQPQQSGSQIAGQYVGLPGPSVQFQEFQSLTPTSRTVVDPNTQQNTPQVSQPASVSTFKGTPGDISTLAIDEENETSVPQSPTGSINFNQALQQAKVLIFKKNFDEAQKISDQINRSNLSQNSKDAFNQQYARLVQVANSSGFNPEAYQLANNLVANLIAANKTYKTDPKVQQLIKNRINAYKLPANTKIPLQTVIQNANQIFNSAITNTQVKKSFNYNNLKNNKKG